MSGGGFMMGIETLWGDMCTCVGLIMGDGGVLNHSIMLGFENEVVEHGLGAFGIVLLVNVDVVGLGRVGSSLGMVGALLDG